MSVAIHRREALGGAGENDFRKCKVLVLEPAVGTRRLLADMLLADLAVGGARGIGTLAEAVKILAAGEYNLLLTDWSGQVDALKLVRLLRSERSFNRLLPVIVMSTNTGPRNLRVIRDAGADEFMPKPFTFRVLASRLEAVVHDGRIYVEAMGYFGPDRRRYRAAFVGPDKRAHANFRQPDRRRHPGKSAQGERRQGRPGFRPAERRSSNVRAKVEELTTVCNGLKVPQVLALRRLTLADPKFQDSAAAADLDDFFIGVLNRLIENMSYERLEELAPGGFEPLMPPGDADERSQHRDLLHKLTKHLFL